MLLHENHLDGILLKETDVKGQKVFVFLCTRISTRFNEFVQRSSQYFPMHFDYTPKCIIKHCCAMASNDGDRYACNYLQAHCSHIRCPKVGWGDEGE